MGSSNTHGGVDGIHTPGPDFRFEFFNNADQQALVERIVRGLQWPYWAAVVHVQSYASKEDGPELSIRLFPHYRKVELDVYGPWFACAAEYQEIHMQHEVFHAVLGPLMRWYDTHVIGPIREKNPELYDHLVREKTEREEAVVQELCYLGRYGNKGAPS